jgi:tellurite resistance protein
MSEDPNLRKRGRTSEDEYFARRDRELIENERRKAADAAELRRLGEALRFSDEEVLTKLRAMGFGPSHVALVHVLPALEVAWSDGAVGQAEGELLKELLRRHSDGQQPSAEAIAKLDDFLATRPPDLVFDQARRAAQIALSSGADEDKRREVATRIMAEARAVAEAGGGLFGLGTVSTPERRALEALAAALGVSA